MISADKQTQQTFAQADYISILAVGWITHGPPLHPVSRQICEKDHKQTKVGKFLILYWVGIEDNSLSVCHAYRFHEHSEKRMLNVTEKTLLKVGTVKITNLRAIFGTKSYQLSNITSASLEAQEPNLFIPVFLAIVLGVFSVLVAISDLGEYSRCLQVGLYSGIAGILFFLISRKANYLVRIHNPVSELVVLETSDRDYAEKVVAALKDAIATYE